MRRVMAWPWLGGAAVIFTVATIQNSADLFLVAALPGAIGLVGLWSGWKQKWLAQPAAGHPADLQELQARLGLAEAELAAVTNDLANLREQREFDGQLQPGQTNLQHPSTGEAM